MQDFRFLAMNSLRKKSEVFLIVMMEQLYHELLIAFLRRLSHLTEGINTSHCVFSYKQ